MEERIDTRMDEREKELYQEEIKLHDAFSITRISMLLFTHPDVNPDIHHLIPTLEAHEEYLEASEIKDLLNDCIEDLKNPE
jgi:hypothetical protein